MAVAVGDVVRIVARLRLNGISDIVNVYHFVVAVDNLLNDGLFMSSVALIMDDIYQTINPTITNNVSYESIDGQNISKDELLPSRTWPILTVGGAAPEMLPEQLAACVFFRTITPRVRASKFLPPFTEGSNDDGAIEASAISNLEDYGDFLVAPLTVTDLELAYVSFNRVTQVATAVDSRVVPARYRTQRRRRIGVGS